MNKGFALVAVLALSSVFVASVADASTMQKSKKKSTSSSKKKSSSSAYSGPETGLLGVKLFDSGLKVLSMYGNPDAIIAVGGGAAASGGGGGNGAPPGGFGGAGGGQKSGGGGGGSTRGAERFAPGDLIPGGFDGPLPDMQGGPPRAAGNSGGGDAPSRPQGGGGNPSGGGAAPGAGGAGGAATESAALTRWSYNRNGCKLAFVVDKFDRVIQIEAIGLQNQRIRTRHGIGFGSSFTSVMKAYASSTVDPDGYDISGNNFTIRFLTGHHVAFRLTQLSTKKAHVVTGIVVAAGKQ
ncbi:MAG: hypothetical protein WCG75_10750 [Armatimonadota bacterium]